MYETEVLIVGAGPTGLTLAIELARRGIDATVLDANFSEMSTLFFMLERCRQLLGMASADQTTPATEPPKDYRDRYEQLTGVSLRLCPVCHQGRMIRIELPTVVCTTPTLRDTS